MISSIDKLPRRQQQAIPALLQRPTVRDAAKAADVREITLFKWMKNPDLQATYRDARYAVMEEDFSVLQKACTEANTFVRLQAAQAMLDIAVKSWIVDELEARFSALEQWQHEEP